MSSTSPAGREHDVWIVNNPQIAQRIREINEELARRDYRDSSEENQNARAELMRERERLERQYGTRTIQY
jgi:hypothetical protein